MIKIIIADDHQMFREGIISLLSHEKDIEIVGEASNGEEVISLTQNKVIDVILLDIEMPIMDGFDTMRALVKNKSTCKVLALTMHHSAEFVKNIIKTGIHGYVKKDAGKEVLLDAIRTVLKDGTYFDQDAQKLVIESLKNNHKTSTLSPRETEIVKCIADGLTTKQIAEKLFISSHTVETHRQNILLKLDQKNAAGLVKYAIQHGLI